MFSERVKIMEERKSFRRNAYGDPRWGRISAIIIGVIVVLALFFLTMFTYVGVGEAALLVDPVTNTVSGPILGPRYFVKAPWVSTVKIYYAVDSLGMWGNGTDPYADFPTVHALSKDGLSMEVDILIRWSLDPSRLIQLYKTYPQLNWKEKAIASIVRETVRNTIAGFDAVTIVENRTIVAETIREHIKTTLIETETLQQSILPESLEVDLRDIRPPTAWLQAIENKLSAQQKMIAAEYERQTVIILANASAQEAIIKAQGEAEAKIIKADAMKDAIQMIAQETGMNATDIAQLYILTEALKEIAEKTGQMIVIMTTTPQGTPILIPIQP